jgi:cytochrome bd-type quinol oxidase subunit 2
METLRFGLWGAVLLLPFVLGHLIYSYWVFRGKVRGERYYG